MQQTITQTQEDFRAAYLFEVVETNRDLRILLCELLQKNHELRVQVAHLHGEG